LMSKTPVVTSADVNVRVASHWSKVPCMATEALTANDIELSAREIAKTGASCARLTDGGTTDAKRQRTTIRMLAGVSPRFIVLTAFRFGWTR
jgi:hypothetical protein